jgi:hypothetical protein
MKKYTKPSIKVVTIQTARMIASSGETRNVNISETEYSGTFNSRGSSGLWDDEDE